MTYTLFGKSLLSYLRRTDRKITRLGNKPIDLHGCLCTGHAKDAHYICSRWPGYSLDRAPKASSINLTAACAHPYED